MNLIPLWARALIVIGLCAALIGGWKWHESSTYRRGYDAAVAERKANDDAQLATKTVEAFAKTIGLQARADQQAVERQKEKELYEKTIDDLRAGARRGNSGMRAPGTCLPGNAAPADPGAAGGPVHQEGYDLLPETAESVLDAASELRRSVQDRNQLIDLYNQMRVTCNSK